MMVQRNPLQRDLFARENNWHERSFLDISQDNRFANSNPTHQPIHPRCLPVETALKDCAGLNVKEFALIVLDDNGDEKTYTSISLTPFQRSIFTERFKQDFRRVVQRTSQGSYPHSAYSQDGYSDFDTDNDMRPRHLTNGESPPEGQRRYLRQSKSEETDEDSGSGRMSRKRHRPADSDDTPVPVPVIKTQQLVIGNDEEVDKFYHVRFKDMQQSSCKIMGKAFVKLIEPKKQTHHPYTKGAAMAPPWWPPTTGVDSVRHREPDHLYKPERIQLLVHILKLIVEPANKQCPAVHKLGLNVRKLEEVTMEALSNWFNDKDHPDNAQKKVYLKEIFKVAKAQERYKDGAIDGTTRIPVQFGDRNGHDNSDDDDDPEEGIKDEDDETEPVSAPTANSDGAVSPTMIQSHNMHQQQDSEFFRGRQIPVRYNTQPQNQIDEHEPYNEAYIARNMNVGYQQMGTNIQEPLRRTFPSTGFQPSPQSNIYGWQSNNMVTNASQSQFYATSPQAGLSQNIPYLPPPITQSNMLPPMTPHHYDGLPNGRFDSAPALGTQLRTGSLGHPHHVPHGYQEYIPENGYTQTNEAENMKHDHPHMHAS